MSSSHHSPSPPPLVLLTHSPFSDLFNGWVCFQVFFVSCWLLVWKSEILKKIPAPILFLYIWEQTSVLRLVWGDDRKIVLPKLCLYILHFMPHVHPHQWSFKCGFVCVLVFPNTCRHCLCLLWFGYSASVVFELAFSAHVSISFVQRHSNCPLELHQGPAASFLCIFVVWFHSVLYLRYHKRHRMLHPLLFGGHTHCEIRLAVCWQSPHTVEPTIRPTRVYPTSYQPLFVSRWVELRDHLKFPK